MFCLVDLEAGQVLVRPKTQDLVGERERLHDSSSPHHYPLSNQSVFELDQAAQKWTLH
jgi:hypothetical protein